MSSILFKHTVTWHSDCWSCDLIIKTPWRQTHPCSASHSSPLLGYTTQLMSGLLSDPAESSSGSTSAGEQQLTPTATSCGDLLAICTASVNGLPSDTHFPSCTKRESFWCADVNNESKRVFLFGSNSYLTREGEPGFRVWELSEQLDQSLRLFDTRDCFKSNKISSCCCQAFDLWPMPCFKLLGREKKMKQRQLSSAVNVSINGTSDLQTYRDAPNNTIVPSWYWFRYLNLHIDWCWIPMYSNISVLKIHIMLLCIYWALGTCNLPYLQSPNGNAKDKSLLTCLKLHT